MIIGSVLDYYCPNSSDIMCRPRCSGPPPHRCRLRDIHGVACMVAWVLRRPLIVGSIADDACRENIGCCSSVQLSLLQFVNCSLLSFFYPFQHSCILFLFLCGNYIHVEESKVVFVELVNLLRSDWFCCPTSTQQLQITEYTL